jgi:tetratricopeptide (TPR) repeat protein
MRTAVVVLGVLLGLSPVVAQEAPATGGTPKRPCQQLLPDATVQHVDRLRADLDRALAAGDTATMQKKVAEIRQIHATLPAGHWQRKSGDDLADRFDKLIAAGEAGRKSYIEAHEALDQADAASRAGKHAEAEATLGKVLATSQALFPPPSHDVADAYRALAAAMREANKLPQAKAHAETALKMMQQTWGEHPQVARAYLVLGDILERSGDPAAAEPNYRRAWEIARNCLGPVSDLAQGSKGLLQKNLVSRGKERTAVAIDRLHLLDELDLGLGPTHPDTLAACRSAAEALEIAAAPAEAEPLHRRVLAAQQANNGPVDEVVGAMQVLLVNLMRQNKAAEVETLGRKMIDLQLTQGEDNPGTPLAYMALGDSLLAVNKVEPGLEALNKALELRRKQLGDAHQGTIGAHNRIAQNLGDLGRDAEAEPHFRKCLELGIKVAGEQNANVAALRVNLGNCLLNQGKLEEAEKCLSEATKVFLVAEGAPGPSSATALLNLGSVRRAYHKYEAALELYTQAHDVIRQSVGDKHPLMAQVYISMGAVLQQLGRDEQAEVMLIEAVKLQRKLHGTENIAWAMAQCDLAECQMRRGKIADAEKLAREAVAALGAGAPGTPELAFAAVTLGRILDAQNKLTQGEGCYRQALALLNGKQTPPRRLGRALSALGTNLHRQKRDADAEPILRQALAGMRQEPLTLVHGPARPADRPDRDAHGTGQGRRSTQDPGGVQAGLVSRTEVRGQRSEKQAHAVHRVGSLH